MHDAAAELRTGDRREGDSQSLKHADDLHKPDERAEDVAS